MGTGMQWSTGKVFYVYFSGTILGGSLTCLVISAGTGASLVGPILGVVLGLGLPVLPAAHAYSAPGRRSRDKVGTSPSS